ncbi:MAG: DUF2254 domain-containing protein, partial [Gemmatimonadetes bacterium]|nr:DUF2254 domain-containing protein [Gemmatimonadota bacterium]
GAEGARGVLSAIAGGLITVTGVAFSVTIVALQLASSQFTPRVLRNFTADRTNRVVLGVLIGTFTYTVLVLRVVRSEFADYDAFVPRIAVSVAVLLVLVSIGFLITFINHAARSIDVSVILDRVARQAVDQVERLFPVQVGDPPTAPAADEDPLDGTPARVPALQSGYLQAVDGNSLLKLDAGAPLVVRMETRIGTFVLPGETLASVWPAARADERIRDAIHRAFIVGPERTPNQDVEFGLLEMADIAVKALSPGINDPTTAFLCIDRLSQVLAALARRDPPPDLRTGDGRVRFIAVHTTFDRAVGLSFDQIRHFGQDNPAVLRKLLDAVTRLSALAPLDRRRPLDALAAGLRTDLEGERP